MSDNWSDKEVLTRTLWGETDGTDAEEMEMIALVALNRFRSGKWWGGYEQKEGQKYPSLKATCRLKSQFACWNRKNPRHAEMLKMAKEDERLQLPHRIADKACRGKLADFGNGAYFYHPKGCRPVWARHHSPCYETKQYLFYNDIQQDM